MENKKTYFQKIIERFNRNKIKYLLIGRQASVLYGLPVTSFDYDLWVLHEYREKVFRLLLNEDFEPSSDLLEKKPIVFFYKDIYKIDIFFANIFGKINFMDAYARATNFGDKDIKLNVCAPEDLIALKKFRRCKSSKDKQDIEFLKG